MASAHARKAVPTTTRASAQVRVIVADDSAVIREGLRAMLATEPGVELLAVCSDGGELERLIEIERPDAAIIDIRMPPSGEREGLRIAAQLRESHPEVGIVILSQHLEPEYALELMRSGTSGRAYLLKDRVADPRQIVNALLAVKSGESMVDPLVVDALIAARTTQRSSPLDDLTPRELEILAQIAEGKSNAAIASSLVLTKRAVEKHVNSIFAKLTLPDPSTVSRRVTVALLFLAEEGQLLQRERS